MPPFSTGGSQPIEFDSLLEQFPRESAKRFSRENRSTLFLELLRRAYGRPW
jgi:hypothetical protein